MMMAYWFPFLIVYKVHHPKTALLWQVLFILLSCTMALNLYRLWFIKRYILRLKLIGTWISAKYIIQSKFTDKKKRLLTTMVKKELLDTE